MRGFRDIIVTEPNHPYIKNWWPAGHLIGYEHSFIHIIADFTGSAPQAVGPVNAIYAVTASAVYNAMLHLTDPTIPRNEGCYRPIEVIAPPLRYRRPS